MSSKLRVRMSKEIQKCSMFPMFTTLTSISQALKDLGMIKTRMMSISIMVCKKIAAQIV